VHLIYLDKLSIPSAGPHAIHSCRTIELAFALVLVDARARFDSPSDGYFSVPNSKCPRRKPCQDWA
jgi:hypothetical protein